MTALPALKATRTVTTVNILVAGALGLLAAASYAYTINSVRSSGVTLGSTVENEAARLEKKK